MIKEHKRHEVGAKGADTESENAAAGQDPAVGHDGDSSSTEPDANMHGERPFETPDREMPASKKDQERGAGETSKGKT